MKYALRSLTVPLCVIGLFVAPLVAAAQDSAAAGENFPGVSKALTPDQYTAAGLSKLTPEERANLDTYLKTYFSGATQKVVSKAVAQASAEAVDRAVKEHKVEPPTVIESRIVGTVSGWNDRTVFRLENGQFWKPTDRNETFHPLDNPQVLIVKDFFSYKMAIAGGAFTRVRRVGD